MEEMYKGTLFCLNVYRPNMIWGVRHAYALICLCKERKTCGVKPAQIKQTLKQEKKSMLMLSKSVIFF
jgi:hypothetical protein